MKESTQSPLSPKHRFCRLGAWVFSCGIFLLLPLRDLSANPHLRPPEPQPKIVRSPTPVPPRAPALQLETREHYLAVSRPLELQVDVLPQAAPNPARTAPSLEAFLARKDRNEPRNAEVSAPKSEAHSSAEAKEGTSPTDLAKPDSKQQETARTLSSNRSEGLFQDDYTHQLAGLSEILYFLETHKRGIQSGLHPAQWG